jgi:hypothetical protein
VPSASRLPSARRPLVEALNAPDLTAAEARRAAALFSCDSCMAGPGVPCRTNTGRLCVWPHTTRLALARDRLTSGEPHM